MRARKMKKPTQFKNNQNGNVAIVFALAAVVITVVAGGAVDYMHSASNRTSLQTVADAAALATARELQLSGAAQGGIDNVAKQYIEANKIDDLDITDAKVKVSEKQATVDILLTAKVPTSFLSFVGLGKEQKLMARSQARILGGLPLCVLALDPDKKQAISASDEARMSAKSCSLYSNSSSAEGITSWDNAEIKTGLTCSAGGAKGGGGNYDPAPLTDCPEVPDPLLERPAPLVTACTETGLVISKGKHVLSKGTYCNGLTIRGKAEVTFGPGEYIIKDGEFRIAENAVVKGDNVAFHFQGEKSFARFTGNAEVSFEGINYGPMAGLLFYGDRSTAYSHVYEISSYRVKKLEGTIYLPNDELRVTSKPTGGGSGGSFGFGSSRDDDDDDFHMPFCPFCSDSNSDSGIASESAYTVIIAKKLTLSGETALVLNTDYASSDVPLPKTISNISGRIVLDR